MRGAPRRVAGPRAAPRAVAVCTRAAPRARQTAVEVGRPDMAAPPRRASWRDREARGRVRTRRGAAALGGFYLVRVQKRLRYRSCVSVCTSRSHVRIMYAHVSEPSARGAQCLSVCALTVHCVVVCRTVVCVSSIYGCTMRVMWAAHRQRSAKRRKDCRTDYRAPTRDGRLTHSSE